MSYEYFSAPAPRAAGGGQDHYPADAALWKGGWIFKKLDPLESVNRLQADKIIKTRNGKLPPI